MASGSKSSASTIATIAVVIPLLVLTYYLSHFFLPMWRWQHLDFVKLSTQTGIPQNRLTQVFQWELRYHPRGAGDPAPWQIISSAPTWGSLLPEEDEDKVLVRCSLISDRDGGPPSAMRLGSGSARDYYFKVTGWRLPGGSLGKGVRKRPLLVYSDMEKMEVGSALSYDSDIRSSPAWENDDTWQSRDDGWEPPQSSEQP
jgi:hypothetical protein